MANAPETLRRVHSYAALISRYKRQLEAIEANIATLAAHGEETWVLRTARQARERLLDKIDKTKTAMRSFRTPWIGCVFVGGDVFYASIPFVLHGAVALLLARQN